MTFTGWRTGSEVAGSRRSLWNTTDVYWISVFEILEQRGFEVMVVNARDAKPYRAARPTSATRSGCNVCTNTACCVPASGPRLKSPDCAPTSGSGSGCSITRRRTSAHAEGADTNEPAATSCHLGHRRRDRYGHRRAIVACERTARSGLSSRTWMPCVHETMCQVLVGDYREEHVYALTGA